MGNVFKTLFMPVGLGGMGVDFRKKTGVKITKAPSYNAEKEQQKAAEQAAEANRKRVMLETDTVQTTALGNIGDTQTQKKTLLGG